MTAPLRFEVFSRSRVILQQQSNATECGLACLAMIATFHGVDTELGVLRSRFPPSPRGTSLKALMATADAIGLSARPVRLAPEHIHELHSPAILHWDDSHFVILEKVRGAHAFIVDPAGQRLKVDRPTFARRFSGIALELRPNGRFEPEKKVPKLKFSQLWRSARGLNRALVQLVVLSLALQALTLAAPYYLQLALDAALPALDGDLLTVLAIGFGALAIFSAALGLLRGFVLLGTGTSMSLGLSSRVARRLLRLPVNWFDSRHVGDILSRFQSVEPLQAMLTQGSAGALIDGAFAILTLGIMLFYSILLTAITLAAVIGYAVVRSCSYRLQKKAQEAQLVASSREQSQLIETIRGIRTIRLANKEVDRFHGWQGRRIDNLNAVIRSTRISTIQGAANALIFGLQNIVVVWLAVRSSMAGGFSVGMIFAYLAYQQQFVGKASSLLDQLFSLRILDVHLTRLSDIALSDEDVSFCEQENLSTPLTGRIEVRNVTYRYGPAEPVVLDDINLAVDPGEHVAITGISGGGKSTLAKILLGLAEPTAGELLIDGKPLKVFGYKSYRDQVSAVLQDDTLFAGTLAENITLFDETPCSEQLIEAAKAAGIHDDIMAMTTGYATLVGDMGSSLSGGQKQRLLLARALYRRPKVLILDEATAHLDPLHELHVADAISAMGITRIIIAHRFETVIRADRILNLARGVLKPVEKSAFVALRRAG